MSFIRPEIRAVLIRWKAALIGGLVACFGLYWTFTTGGFLPYAGAAVFLVGLALVWDGIRRARFPMAGGGLGVVELDERQISYLGPLGGGALSLNDIIRIQIITTDNGQFNADVLWQFTDSGGQRLMIPTNAVGADGIFDALAAFNGADYSAATAAQSSRKNQSFMVWQETPVQIH